jgi:hypothetical protein
MTARRPIQTIDYAGVKGTSVDANWVGPAGPPYKALAGLAVLLLAILLVSSPALIALLAIFDAQVLDRLLPWLGSAARIFSLLDLVRGLLVVGAAGLVLTGRADA